MKRKELSMLFGAGAFVLSALGGLIYSSERMYYRAMLIQECNPEGRSMYETYDVAKVQLVTENQYEVCFSQGKNEKRLRVNSNIPLKEREKVMLPAFWQEQEVVSLGERGNTGLPTTSELPIKAIRRK